VKADRFCACSERDARPVEGIWVCASCGERVADPLLLLIAAQQRILLARIERLEGGQEEAPAENGATRLLSPAELATRLGKSRTWIYEHADELGAIRLGDGTKPRLSFDLAIARERLAALAGGHLRPAPKPHRKRRRRSGNGGPPLLPIKGSTT
jgi:hypothetical protein